MIKLLFICHGNICRSPMAEFVMKDLVKKAGFADQFHIASSATSREEIGNPPHHGTKKKLLEFGISTAGKYAVQLTKADYSNFDYLIGMDSYNRRNILKIVGNDPDGKVCCLLDFAGGGEIADPWYTGDFDKTYDDVFRGCTALLKKLTHKNPIKT